MSDIPERVYQDAARAGVAAWYGPDSPDQEVQKTWTQDRAFRATVEAAYRAGVASQQAVIDAARAVDIDGLTTLLVDETRDHELAGHLSQQTYWQRQLDNLHTLFAAIDALDGHE